MDELLKLGVFEIKNGSAELFFDDEGILQQVIYRKKRRRVQGETLNVHGTRSGTVLANYDNDGTLQVITVETSWKRKLAKND
jgi:hypothetical protein